MFLRFTTQRPVGQYKRLVGRSKPRPYVCSGRRQICFAPMVGRTEARPYVIYPREFADVAGIRRLGRG